MQGGQSGDEEGGDNRTPAEIRFVALSGKLKS
jgi:hypothetical protein